MISFRKLSVMQFKLFSREPVALFFTIAFPVLLLVLFGVIFGNDIDPAFGFGYIDAQVPGLTAIIIGTVALLSVPIATATAREQKILRRYWASPMQPTTYLAADIFVNFFIALLGMFLLVVIGILVFDLRFNGNIISVLAGFTLCTLSFMAAGYVLASLAPTSRIAQVVGQVLLFPMMFLSGAALPQNLMPESIIRLSEFLPLTHVVRLMQDLWFGVGWNWTAVIVLSIMLVLGVVVAAATFRWQ